MLPFVFRVVLPSRLRTYTQAGQSVSAKEMVLQQKDMCIYSDTELPLRSYEALNQPLALKKIKV